MKKNLLSIIVLALLVVNIALTAVMMFSIMGTNKKTAAIVTDIADILALELDKGGNGASSAPSLADTEVFTTPDQLTITLKPDEGDTAAHYCMVKVSLSMDTSHEDYETYSDIASKESLINSTINTVISSYTISEAQLMQDVMCQQILEKLQALYGSDFIYQVSFSSIVFQ